MPLESKMVQMYVPMHHLWRWSTVLNFVTKKSASC